MKMPPSPYVRKLRSERHRHLVRDMLRVIFGLSLYPKLRKMRKAQGTKHGPFRAVARALGGPVTARDVRYVWTGRQPGSDAALERIVSQIEKHLRRSTHG